MATSRRSIIWDAMVHMKRKNGATFGEIRKHLETNHKKKLNPTNKKILSSTLQGLVQSGLVEKRGSMYKLGLIQAANRNKTTEEVEVPARKRRLPKRYRKTHHFIHRGHRRALPQGYCKKRRLRPKASQRKRSRRRRKHHRRRHHKRQRR